VTVAGIPEPKLPSSRLSPAALRRERGWADDDFIVMYSGNMGLGHCFGEFLKAASALTIEHPASPMSHAGTSPKETCSRSSASNSQPSPNIRFVFYGGGKRRVEIENFISRHPECGIELHDYAPAENLTAHLQSADVHLASLDAAWSGTMVPSKLQGIFAAGRPVIFIGSVESSIGRWIAESGGGWVVAPEDSAGLLAALAEARDPQTRRVRGDSASAYARLCFDRNTNAARVAEIFTR